MWHGNQEFKNLRCGRQNFAEAAEVGEVVARGGRRRRVDARSLFCFWAVREVGNSLAPLAVRLEMSRAGVGYDVQREEAIAHGNGYKLSQ